jgi:hypothetical protein
MMPLRTADGGSVVATSDLNLAKREGMPQKFNTAGSACKIDISRLSNGMSFEVQALGKLTETVSRGS